MYNTFQTRLSGPFGDLLKTPNSIFVVLRVDFVPATRRDHIDIDTDIDIDIDVDINIDIHFAQNWLGAKRVKTLTLACPSATKSHDALQIVYSAARPFSPITRVCTWYCTLLCRGTRLTAACSVVKSYLSYCRHLAPSHTNNTPLTIYRLHSRPSVCMWFFCWIRHVADKNKANARKHRPGLPSLHTRRPTNCEIFSAQDSCNSEQQQQYWKN